MGRPKAWLPFGAETMLARLVRTLKEAVAPVIVVAAPDQETPLLPDTVELVRDTERGWGPLAGLAAGLGRAAELGLDAAYASACDAPFLQPTLVRRVIDLLGDADVAVPYVEGRHHPLAAVYRVGVVAEIERLLAADRRRPVFLFETVPTRFISADELSDADPALASLRNLNTPDDYQAALREAGFASG
jgi:molybdopterin-guanine dinucleotide biosynthesis protein A